MEFANDVDLLSSVLAAESDTRARPDAVALLKALLSHASQQPQINRKLSLFEAMGVLDLENPHSDYLAWLLDPRGPLTGNWLLRSLLSHVAPSQTWSDPLIVEREVLLEDGRPDIVITWPAFKLVIENKIWSKEGDQQIARYLKSCGITSSGEGKVVYLTPTGLRPKSVAVGDDRVVALGYAKLAELITAGLGVAGERQAEGDAFADEFRKDIHRLLRIRETTMIKPTVSEATKIYLGRASQFMQIEKNAVDEFAGFFDWIISEARRQLESQLGSKIFVQEGKYTVLLRFPEWKVGDIGFGFCLAVEHDWRKDLVSKSDSGPWVGIGVGRLDDEYDKIASQAVVDVLKPRLLDRWPHPSDRKGSDYSMALWREVRIAKDGDLDRWAESIFTFLREMAAVLTPIMAEITAKQS